MGIDDQSGVRSSNSSTRPVIEGGFSAAYTMASHSATTVNINNHRVHVDGSGDGDSGSGDGEIDNDNSDDDHIDYGSLDRFEAPSLKKRQLSMLIPKTLNLEEAEGGGILYAHQSQSFDGSLLVQHVVQRHETLDMLGLTADPTVANLSQSYSSAANVSQSYSYQHSSSNIGLGLNQLNQNHLSSSIFSHTLSHYRRRRSESKDLSDGELKTATPQGAIIAHK